MNTSLSYRADGSFVIAQFTDTHFEGQGEADARTSALMERVLEEEAPDLAIFTGDILAGAAVQDVRAAWAMAVAPLIRRGIPWAAVFGNHDDEGPASRAQLLAIQRRLAGCLTQAGPRHLPGLGNFILSLGASSSRREPFALCCLDSHAYAPASVGGYAWVQAAQIRWLHSSLHRLSLASAGSLQALVFLHIPLPEYDQLWAQGQCRGLKQEAVCCPRINSGLFAALHGAGLVRGVFAGHDHINDFEGELFGLRLCYGRASGYNTYGREGFMRGARVIRLAAGEQGFSTWLRLEDGSKLAQTSDCAPAE